jgi:hypothetical protein
MTAGQSLNSAMPFAVSIAPPADYTTLTGSQVRPGTSTFSCGLRSGRPHRDAHGGPRERLDLPGCGRDHPGNNPESGARKTTRRA